MPTVSTPGILRQMNDGPMYRPLSLKGHSFKAFTSSQAAATVDNPLIRKKRPPRSFSRSGAAFRASAYSIRRGSVLYRRNRRLRCGGNAFCGDSGGLCRSASGVGCCFRGPGGGLRCFLSCHRCLIRGFGSGFDCARSGLDGMRAFLTVRWAFLMAVFALFSVSFAACLMG